MIVHFKKSLAKDLKSINNAKTQAKITEVISNIKNAEVINDLANIKKLHGQTNAYRIRIGDYRMGLFVENGEVTISRILKRNDIYKVFP